MAALETANGGRCSAALMVSSAFSTNFLASCRTPCGDNLVKSNIIILLVYCLCDFYSVLEVFLKKGSSSLSNEPWPPSVS